MELCKDAVSRGWKKYRDLQDVSKVSKEFARLVEFLEALSDKIVKIDDGDLEKVRITLVEYGALQSIPEADVHVFVILHWLELFQKATKNDMMATLQKAIFTWKDREMRAEASKLLNDVSESLVAALNQPDMKIKAGLGSATEATKDTLIKALTDDVAQVNSSKCEDVEAQYARVRAITEPSSLLSNQLSDLILESLLLTELSEAVTTDFEEIANADVVVEAHRIRP